jgi:hypothetical protein
MLEYVIVINGPNRVATVHRMSCNSLGVSPLQQSPNAKRESFDYALDAILAVHSAMPENYGLCGHCLKTYRIALANCCA